MSTTDAPETLYRFRTLNKFTYDEILNRNIFFSSPNNFNDPFEFQFDFSSVPVAAGQMADFLGKYNPKYTSEKCEAGRLEIIQSLTELMKKKQVEMGKKGVCCFSAKYDNRLLWSHYADGHRGLCIAYNMNQFNGKVFKVRYSDNPAKAEVEGNNFLVEKMVSDFMWTKQMEWEYEEEYRVMHAEGNKKVYLERDTITSIFFGVKTPKEDMDAVARAANTNNSRVKYFQMAPGDATWNLRAEARIFDPE